MDDQPKNYVVKVDAKAHGEGNIASPTLLSTHKSLDEAIAENEMMSKKVASLDLRRTTPKKMVHGGNE